jgi:hypothetical protein
MAPPQEKTPVGILCLKANLLKRQQALTLLWQSGRNGLLRRRFRLRCGTREAQHGRGTSGVGERSRALA